MEETIVGPPSISLEDRSIGILREWISNSVRVGCRRHEDELARYHPPNSREGLVALTSAEASGTFSCHPLHTICSAAEEPSAQGQVLPQSVTEGQRRRAQAVSASEILLRLAEGVRFLS